MKKSILILLMTFLSYDALAEFNYDACDHLPDVICNPGRHEAMKKSTTDQKAKYHVIFREEIDSENQKSWKQGYQGVVELWVDGELKSSHDASTLPNNINVKAPDHIYSVLLSTCHHNRFYTWKRGLRADGERHALRLQHETPTVNISTIRNVHIPKYLSKRGHFNFAKNILVHKGWKKKWRGSHGCLTIDPDDSPKFFSKIPMGTKGTLEVIRKVTLLPPAGGEFCY